MIAPEGDAGCDMGCGGNATLVTPASFHDGRPDILPGKLVVDPTDFPCVLFTWNINI